MALNASMDRDVFGFSSGLSGELVSLGTTVTALSAMSETELVPAPGAGYRIVVTAFDVIQADTANVRFALLDGVGGTRLLMLCMGANVSPNFQGQAHNDLNLQLSENKPLKLLNDSPDTALTCRVSFQYAIVACDTYPTIVLTAPTGATSWARGTTQAITWTATGAAGMTVSIRLWYERALVTVINPVLVSNVVATLGTWDWAIPAGLPIGSDTYEVEVKLNETNISYRNTNDFALT